MIIILCIAFIKVTIITLQESQDYLTSVLFPEQSLCNGLHHFMLGVMCHVLCACVVHSKIFTLFNLSKLKKRHSKGKTEWCCEHCSHHKSFSVCVRARARANAH